MSIIDFHTHPHGCAAHNFAFYPNVVPDDAQAMKAQLRALGVDHICGSVLRADRGFDMTELNNAALTLRDELGADFYTPGFHIHPHYMEQSLSEIERMHAAGVKLIGELVPYMHGWNDFDKHSYIEELNALLDAAEKHNMVVSYHTLWDWDIEPVIAAHPNMAFVAAHPGERAAVEKHIARMRRHDNLFLDLPGAGMLRYGCIRYLADHVGAHRILMGSDYPICNPDLYIRAIRAEGLTEPQTRLILHDNAARLLRLTI